MSIIRQAFAVIPAFGASNLKELQALRIGQAKEILPMLDSSTAKIMVNVILIPRIGAQLEGEARAQERRGLYYQNDSRLSLTNELNRVRDYVVNVIPTVIYYTEGPRYAADFAIIKIDHLEAKR